MRVASPSALTRAALRVMRDRRSNPLTQVVPQLFSVAKGVRRINDEGLEHAQHVFDQSVEALIVEACRPPIDLESVDHQPTE